jgi:hypothetical protein
MKEAYRLNKHMLPLGSENPRRAIMFIYIGKEILQYPSVVKAMMRILQILKKNSTRRIHNFSLHTYRILMNELKKYFNKRFVQV